jgi:hypothetical protein
MNGDKSVPQLFSDLIDNLSSLFRQEVRLAKTEFTEGVENARGGVAYIAAGTMVGLGALIVLLGALVAWLAWMGLDVRWGALAVGLVAAGIAAFLAMKGIRDLKSTAAVPGRVMDQLHRDARVAKESLQ